MTSLQERAQRSDIFGLDRTGPINLDGVVGEGRQTQSFLENSTVRVRIGAHPALTHRREFLQFGDQLAVLIKQFLGLLRAHPLLENLQLLGILLDFREWNLVRPPEAFDPVAADLYRRAPALRGTQNNHGPARPVSHAAPPAFLLMQPDFPDAMFHRRRHRLVHAVGIGSLDEVRRPAVASEKIL